MTFREAYVYGWIYEKIERAIGGVSNAQITQAPMRPLSSFAEIHAKAMTLRVVDDNLAEVIGDALDKITFVDPTDESEKVAPLEMQGTWQLGYYHSRAGRELSPPDEYDLAAKRRAKKLSQAQLAEMVGVSQAQVSKWEKGQANPTDENLQKLMEALS